MSQFETTFSVPCIYEEKDFEITVEFTVTSWGSSPSYWDPGDPIEWEIDKLYLDGEEIPYSYQKNRFWVPPEQQLREALWQSLADAATTYIDEHFDWSDAHYDDYED